MPLNERTSESKIEYNRDYIMKVQSKFQYFYNRYFQKNYSIITGTHTHTSTIHGVLRKLFIICQCKFLQKLKKKLNLEGL